MININAYVGETKFILGKKVDFVLVIRDSFTDGIMNEDIPVRFFINGDFTNPIRKQDGYYVFTDVYWRKFRLDIKLYGYFDKNMDIDLDEFNSLNICKNVFLIPHYKYTVPPSNRKISGKADVNTEVYATRLSNRTNIRYQSVDNEGFLKISNPADENLVGKVLAIVDYKKPSFEMFFVEERLSRDIYKIDRQIKTDFYEGAPIQKAYVTKADGFGDVTMYVSNVNTTDNQYMVSYVKDGKNEMKVIDFTEHPNVEF